MKLNFNQRFAGSLPARLFMCDHEPKYAKGLCRKCYCKDQHKKHYQSQKEPISLESIKLDYDNGMRLADIAAKHDKSEPTIFLITKEQGWTRVKPPRSHPKVQLTYEALANRLGLQRRTLHDYASLYEETELCDRIQSLDPDGKRWKPVKNENNYTYGFEEA